jgi:putative inorganic carbon (hco3(-)) transporter
MSRISARARIGSSPQLPRRQAAPTMEAHAESPGAAAFALYCAFMCSFLLNLAKRIPLLGSLHADFVVGGIALLLAVLSRQSAAGGRRNAPKWSEPGKWLVIMVVYLVISLPFVQWPGSVIRHGAEPFAKAVVFFALTVATVNSSRRLSVFIWVLLACQCFRVLEPLYLHVAEGYWGSMTYMGDSVIMSRLSGAPNDSINANGLAFLVVTTLGFIHYFLAATGTFGRVLYWLLLSAFVYVLLLTGSRSGLLVLLVGIGVIVYYTRFRTTAIVISLLSAVLALGSLSGLQKERFESIFSSSAAGASTAHGRIEFVKQDFMVALKRPLFGHGLGTSAEANAHGRGYGQISHNLFTEVAQETGFVGLGIFLGFLWSAYMASKEALEIVKNGNRGSRLQAIARALHLTMICGFVFAFASYGFSEMYWYLWAGICVSIGRIVITSPNEAQTIKPREPACERS